MQPLPHHYEVTVDGNKQGHVTLTSPGLKPLTSAPPAQFGGPGNLWSPETLTIAAVGDCLILTFRAVADIAKLSWTNLTCDVEGTVDRSEGSTRFTKIHMHAHLVLPAGVDTEKARNVLEKAEKACLVGNSLNVEPTLEVDVAFEDAVLAPSA